MTCELATLQRLRVTTEAAGIATFAIDDSANVGTNGIDVPLVDGTIKWDPGRETLDPKTGSIYVDFNPTKLPGRLLPSIGFKTALHSHGIDLNGTNAAPTTTNWAQLRMLQAIFGGSFATGTKGSNTTVQAGTTATVVNVTATHGTRWTVGDVIGCQCVAGSSIIEVRRIASIATDAITVDQAFSATPTTGTVVRGAVAVHLTEDPQTSLQFVLEGTELDQRMVFMGCQGSVKLELPVGGIPMISYDLKGADWKRLSSASVAASTLTNYQPIVAVASELTVPTVASSTRVLVDQCKHDIDIAIAYDPMRVGKGVNTIRRWRRKRVQPAVKGSFTTVFEDATWETAYTAQTPLRIYQQLGNLPGNTLFISMPTVQVVDAKDAVHESGIGGVMVPYEARHATGGTDEKTRSVVTIYAL